MRVPAAKTLLRAAWFAFGIVCLSRAVAYSNFFGPPHESPGPWLLTDEGRTLWWFALLWALIGVLLIVEACLARFSSGLLWMGALMVVWGGTYAMSWMLSHFESPDWITMCLYVCIGVGLAFAGLAVSVLGGRVSRLEHENTRLRVALAVTEPNGQGRGGNGSD